MELSQIFIIADEIKLHVVLCIYVPLIPHLLCVFKPAWERRHCSWCHFRYEVTRNLSLRNFCPIMGGHHFDVDIIVLFSLMLPIPFWRNRPIFCPLGLFYRFLGLEVVLIPYRRVAERFRHNFINWFFGNVRKIVADPSVFKWNVCRN